MNDRIAIQLRRWREELIDLTRRNRLLRVTPNRSSVIEITEPGASAILAGLDADEGWRFHYPPHDDVVTDDAVLRAIETEDPDLDDTIHPDELVSHLPKAIELSRALHNLERRASQEYMDTGLHVLYLSIGMLEWADVDGQPMTSPLVLVPVALTRPNPRAPYRLTGTEDEPVSNPALAVKLNEIELPEFNAEDGILEYVAAWQTVTAALPGARVTERVILSLFTFHKEAMYQDLVANEELVAAHPAVVALALGPEGDADFSFEPISENRLDEVAPPEQLVAIRDADATQRICIAAAAAGKSFVMDGPPGTGKSQTIANMIAELLHAGKTVLFVSEKAAALEVVKSRLDDCQLGHFVLELHSHNATRKEVAQALGIALIERPRANHSMTSTDVSRVRQRREQLSAYAAGLNERREPLGLSVFDALGRFESIGELPDGPLPESIGVDLSADQMTSILDAAADLAAAWGPVTRGDRFLWRDLADAPTALRQIGEIRRTLEVARQVLADLSDRSEAISNELALPAPNTRQQASELLAIVRMLGRRPDVPATWLCETAYGTLRARVIDLEAAAEARAASISQLDAVSARWSELDPALDADIRDASQRLETLDPSIVLHDAMITEELRHLARFLVDAPDDLAAIEHEASQIAEAFRLRPAMWSVEETRRVIALGTLGAAECRPEASWLDPSSGTAAHAAAAVLRPIVDEYRLLASQLAEHFNEELNRIDIESLYADEHDTSPKLGRLSSDGRRNRRNLAACTRSGKIDDATKSLLGSARSWQRVRGQLDALERTHAPTLASYYPSRDTADFQRIDSALAIADQAIALVGASADATALASHLATQSLDAEAIGKLSLGLRDRLNELESLGARLLGTAFESFANRPTSELAAWMREAARPAVGIVKSLESVDELDVQGVSTLGPLRSVAKHRAAVHSADAQSESQRAENELLLGSLYRGNDSHWSELRDAISWAEQLTSLLDGPVEPYTANRLMATAMTPDGLASLSDDAQKYLSSVSAIFTPQRASIIEADVDVNLSAGIELLDELRDTTGDIDEWNAFTTAQARLQSLGLGATTEFCIAREVDSAQVVALNERALLTAWIEAVLHGDDRIRPTRSLDRDRLVSEFRELDEMLRLEAAARVINACSARRPSTALGAAGIIQREAEKKRRHMPIRELLLRTGEVALACKPCFMMSPLAVSQFIPSSLVFDTVIFDEASQVRPSDAINSIYRGKQLIVAGDNKQLPPTSFFDRSSNDAGEEWAEDQLDDFESLLDLAKAAGSIPSLPLRWHYRSRHESLITYSNYSFYDGKLVTYPGALEKSDDVGVSFLHVPDGVYSRGGDRSNPIEAQAVVERVMWFAQHRPELSVGVVALSDAQASRIGYELEYARRDRPDLDEWFVEDRLNGFFVKNLESVQGDERDVILFSIGYGRDEVGKLTMNFGPINAVGGWRRLNVAVTRARQRVEVVSSIVAGDITETGSQGLAHFKRYLDYAQRGISALAVDLTDSHGDAESPFEEEVLRVIRGMGYDAVPQVGQAGYRIDIGVRHPDQPGRYAIGIECDGAAYHSSRVARDRDRLRQQILEGLGWTLHRIWGPAWYRSKTDEVQRLRAAIETAISGEQPALASPPTTTTTTTIRIEIHEKDMEAPPDWTQPYEVASTHTRIGAAMDDPAATHVLQQTIMEIVRLEGPIVKGLLAERVRNAYGAGRMGARMQAAFDGSVQRLTRSGQIEELDRESLVLAGCEVDRVRTPTTDPGSRRTAREVPQVELRAALLRLVNEARTISEDELAVNVARIFGWNRRGVEIQAALGRAQSTLESRGDIVRRADGMLVPKP